jgi:hypothetical protein
MLSGSDQPHLTRIQRLKLLKLNKYFSTPQAGGFRLSLPTKL